MQMYMGYYYNEPKRGKGFRLEANFGSGSLVFDPIIKCDAMEIRRQMLLQGYSKDDITLEKNR
jgi:hypothetical protein